MKQFKKFISEAIGIKDGKLYFDYNNFVPDNEQISSKFGKGKFVPYTKKITTTTGHVIYSVYYAKGIKKVEILKALKRKSNVSLDETEYKQFIKRTVNFIDYKIVRAKGIKYILFPHSSSNILVDVANILSKKNPKLKILSAFSKLPVQNIQVNIADKRVTPKIEALLQREIDKAKDSGYFEMKKIPVMYRKFLFDVIGITPDISLESIEGSNVAILDDIVSSGNSMLDMFFNTELYSPNKVIGITLFKT
jgi:hypothetical protein